MNIIKDKALKKCLNEALGRSSEEPITSKDMESLTILEMRNQDIKKLKVWSMLLI